MANIFIKKYRHWKYKNTFLLVLSLVFLFYFADSGIVKSVLEGLKGMGVFGIFIAGVFFCSTFTIAPASLVLFYLAQELNPLQVVIFGGMGGVVGDYIIFRFMKDKVFQELRPVFMSLGGSHLSRIFSTPYFAWLAPVVGALIIASPMPDELGVSLLGISNLKTWQFLVISFLMNSLGILIIISLAIF